MKRRVTQDALGLLCLSALLFLVPAEAQAQCSAAWTTNVAYAAGANASYNNRNYRCAQAHTSQVGWEPPNVPALWTDLGACGAITGTPTLPPPPTPTSRPRATPTIISGTATP